MSVEQANVELITGAYFGLLDKVKQAVKDGADVEFVSPETGLNALHTAVGRSQIAVVKYLLEEVGASIKQDRFGRWPTVTAAQCESSEEMCDYIVEKEAEALGIEISSGDGYDEQAS